MNSASERSKIDWMMHSLNQAPSNGSGNGLIGWCDHELGVCEGELGQEVGVVDQGRKPGVELCDQPQPPLITGPDGTLDDLCLVLQMFQIGV